MSLGADGAQTSADGATFPPAVSEATGPPPKSSSQIEVQVQVHLPNPPPKTRSQVQVQLQLPGPVFFLKKKTVFQEPNGSGGAYTQRSV